MAGTHSQVYLQVGFAVKGKVNLRSHITKSICLVGMINLVGVTLSGF